MSADQSAAALSSALTLAAVGGFAAALVLWAAPSRPTANGSQFVVGAFTPASVREGKEGPDKSSQTIESSAEFEPLASRRKGRRSSPLAEPSPADKSATQDEQESEAQGSAKDVAPPPGPLRSVEPAGRNENAKSGARDGTSDSSKLAPSDAAKDLPVTSEASPKSTWTDAEIITALRECLGVLTPLDVEIVPADPVRNGDCGDAAPVKLKSVGKSDKVTFEPSVEVNCELAARLATWVQSSLQPAARQVMSSPVTKIVGASGYSCRNRYGLPDAPLSEHATGNAVDVPAFVLANGRTIRVAQSWGPTARDIEAMKTAAPANAVPSDGTPPKQAASAKDATAKDQKPEPAKEPAGATRSPELVKAGKVKVAATDLKSVPIQKLGAKPADPMTSPASTPVGGAAIKPTTEGLFLRRLAKEACETFGTVLGPEANEAHRDHFHFDIKARRKKAYCE